MVLEVDQNIKLEIERLTKEAFGVFNLQNPQPGIDFLIEAYNKIPEPRNVYSDSFNLIKYIAIGYFRAGLLPESEKWLPVFLDCDNKVMNYGESEFLAGKIAFEKDNKTEAIQYFIIANQKSEGRVFKSKDEKTYFSFFKKQAKDHVRPQKFEAMLEVAISEIGNKNYVYALSLLYDCINIQLDNALVHVKKGICHFELNEFDKASDSFTRAYMLEAETIFKNEDSKYFNFLKTKIQIN